MVAWDTPWHQSRPRDERTAKFAPRSSALWLLLSPLHATAVHDCRRPTSAPGGSARAPGRAGTVVVARSARASKAKTIAVTSFVRSPSANACGIVLFTGNRPDHRTLEPFTPGSRMCGSRRQSRSGLGASSLRTERLVKCPWRNRQASQLAMQVQGVEARHQEERFGSRAVGADRVPVSNRQPSAIEDIAVRST